MKVYMNSVEKSYTNYERLFANLLKYEDTCLDFYADGDLSSRALSHPGATETKESIAPTIKQWKNPYREAYIWIKGELLKQTELEKMSLGKTTMKSFFKSKSTIEKDIVAYQQGIEALTHEIEDYRKLINFITIYHGHMAIEKYKANKV
jgi:soluble cytochrome b562